MEEKEGNSQRKTVIKIPSYQEVLDSKSTTQSLFVPSQTFSQAFAHLKSSEFYSPPPPPSTQKTISISSSQQQSQATDNDSSRFDFLSVALVSFSKQFVLLFACSITNVADTIKPRSSIQLHRSFIWILKCFCDDCMFGEIRQANVQSSLASNSSVPSSSTSASYSQKRNAILVSHRQVFF